MQRLGVLAGVLVIAAALLGQAAPTWARGDDWQPLPAAPFDATVCGANLHFEFPVNNEYFRIVRLGGQDVFQVTGVLTTVITNTDTGQVVTEANISGPGFSPLSAAEFSARGLNLLLLTPDQAASTGLPELFVNDGYVDVVFNADGTLTVNKLTGQLTDLCLLLT
jgi:hypothetical protein